MQTAKLWKSLNQNIKELVNEPNFQSLNLGHLGSCQIQSIVSSIKTRTLLQLLEQPKFEDLGQKTQEKKPIVLVLCQPSEQLSIDRKNTPPYSAVSYIQWLETTGAFCIPLPYNTNQATIEFLVDRSQGLLIPGGGSNLYRNFDAKEGFGPVMNGFAKIWRYINKLWAKGIRYPLWGTCLGLQIVLLMITNDTKTLSQLNSRGHQVEIYSQYEDSFILNEMPIELRIKAQNYKLLNFQHSYGITVKKFLKTQKLKQKLKICQISKDKNSKWFCSGLQGIKLPIFLSQYHPEKQAFQWTRTGQIVHNRDSIELSQYLAKAFLKQCAKCKPSKKFISKIEENFYSFHNYHQIWDKKMYKVYVIDFKYRKNDKQTRKEMKTQRSMSTAAGGQRKLQSNFLYQFLM